MDLRENTMNIEPDNNHILEILYSIKKEIKSMNNDILEIKTKLNNLESTSLRMDSHISFIEKTYNKFKTPLNILKNSTEKFLGIYKLKSDNYALEE